MSTRRALRSVQEHAIQISESEDDSWGIHAYGLQLVWCSLQAVACSRCLLFQIVVILSHAQYIVSLYTCYAIWSHMIDLGIASKVFIKIKLYVRRLKLD